MPNRCSATDTLTVDGQPLELRCVHWSNGPEGRHTGDHLVHMPPAMGGDHTWPNESPLPEDDAEGVAP